jgi:hypothetical protein
VEASADLFRPSVDLCRIIVSGRYALPRLVLQLYNVCLLPKSVAAGIRLLIMQPGSRRGAVQCVPRAIPRYSLYSRSRAWYVPSRVVQTVLSEDLDVGFRGKGSLELVADYSK